MNNIWPALIGIIPAILGPVLSFFLIGVPRKLHILERQAAVYSLLPEQTKPLVIPAIDATAKSYAERTEWRLQRKTNWINVVAAVIVTAIFGFGIGGIGFWTINVWDGWWLWRLLSVALLGSMVLLGTVCTAAAFSTIWEPSESNNQPSGDRE